MGDQFAAVKNRPRESFTRVPRACSKIFTSSRTSANNAGQVHPLFAEESSICFRHHIRRAHCGRSEKKQIGVSQIDSSIHNTLGFSLSFRVAIGLTVGHVSDN